jgi:hypothetical protein
MNQPCDLLQWHPNMAPGLVPRRSRNDGIFIALRYLVTVRRTRL